MGGGAGPDPTRAGEARQGGGERRAHHGRALSGGQGVSRGLLDRGCRNAGSRVRDRREGLSRPWARWRAAEHGDRGASGDGRRTGRGVTAEGRTKSIEHLLRELAPQVLGAVARRHGDFAAAEDAVQEALIAAAQQWPEAGVPANPRGWLYHVALRRLTDHLRSEMARRQREGTVATELWAQWAFVPPADAEVGIDRDDTLVLLFMCCHPALTTASAVALTLRVVGGLTTAEIARAFFVPEATMAQRISRAKQTIRTSGIPFGMPSDEERADRLRAVLHILYLIFNEGYTSSAGPELQRVDLSNEAIRLTRLLHELLPNDPEVLGLLALMLLTDARRAARTGPDGE